MIFNCGALQANQIFIVSASWFVANDQIHKVFYSLKTMATTRKQKAYFKNC